jgi:Ni,Fe-hydrogenase III small subunit/formate hydrogenlyase subunit 6/NADH:ubiquinone oxidoreductase subunit I
VLDLFRQRLLRGLATNDYPGVVEPTPPAFRGMPRLREDRCCQEAACAAVCPANSITVLPLATGGWSWTLDRASCIGCGRCIEVCPHDALEAESVFELAARSREELRVTTTVHGSVAQDDAAEQRELDALGARLRTRTAQLFGRSLQLRHLDVGSCNGCDWELNALLNPVYDLQRFGVDVVASPRHADGLLVTGAVTRHLEPALWATYEATPDPKLVIAIGACAGDAGFLAGSYAIAGGVDRRLPVDVYVPGCPPRPEAILRGILLAMGRV